LSIKGSLLHALLDDVGIFGISTKLAAIEAIGRVSPRSPRINYQMAGRAAHIGLLFFRFITLGLVVSSCCADGRLREMRPTTTLKRAAAIVRATDRKPERFSPKIVVAFSLRNAKWEYTSWVADYCFGF
jgi:hypothetical protein